VLADATFRRRRDRDAFAEAFGKAGPLLSMCRSAPVEAAMMRSSGPQPDYIGLRRLALRHVAEAFAALLNRRRGAAPDGNGHAADGGARPRLSP
jgi:hypothetical protein